MKVLKFNVSKPKKYQDKDGSEKTQWNNIGTITEFHKDDGTVSRIIEIPAINLEANIFPFENKEKDTKSSAEQEYDNY
jgi:hypothetical protein